MPATPMHTALLLLPAPTPAPPPPHPICAASFHDQLQHVHQEVKSICFAADDSALLALGFEGGAVKLVDFPGMVVQREIRWVGQGCGWLGVRVAGLSLMCTPL